MNEAGNKFKEGSTVYALAFPDVRLVIRRYLDRIYFCRLAEDPTKEIPYFERELTDQPSEATQRVHFTQL